MIKTDLTRRLYEVLIFFILCHGHISTLYVLLACCESEIFIIQVFLCPADLRVSSTTEPPPTHHPMMNTTYTPAFSTTSHPPDNSTVGIFNSSETSITTPLTSSVPYNSSHGPLVMSSTPYTSLHTTMTSALPATTCRKEDFIFINCFE